MNSIKVTAYAKVNLFLNILNKRNDGYHSILTLFERVSLADEITISKAPAGITVSSDKFITHDPKDNLVYKAAALMTRRGRIKSGLRIEIKKRIPIAGGMGGGSSDAAAVLAGINKLFGLRIGRGELTRLGSKLGSDVPFFLRNAPFAVGQGRGEILKRMKTGLKLWHVIICPDFRLSTKYIYDELDKRRAVLTKDGEGDKIRFRLRHPVNLGAVESILHNDLGSVAISKKAVLRRIIERLAASCGSKAIVSGSGPSVFCLCGSRKEAIGAKNRFLKAIPARSRVGWQIFVAETE